MQRAESHARRRNVLDLGPQDYVTQLVYVHQLYFRGMRGPEWHFRRSGNVRDRSNRLRELPRREEGRAPFPSSSYHLSRAFPFRSTLRFVRARRADAASPPNPNHNPDTVLATPAARPTPLHWARRRQRLPPRARHLPRCSGQRTQLPKPRAPKTRPRERAYQLSAAASRPASSASCW
jgi:hypothetical protein